MNIQTAIKSLADDIEAHAKKVGLSEATICGRGAGNNRLYKNLRRGSPCSPEIENRLRAFMDEQSKSKKATA